MALIGFGRQFNYGLAENDEEVSQDKSELERIAYTRLSILFALLSGLSVALNTWVMKHYVKAHQFGVIQLNLDGYLLCSLVLLVGFFMYGPENYSWQDIGSSFLSSFFQLVGFALMTQALKTGQGGPIQAVDSLKVLMPLVLGGAFDNKPLSLMQYGGMLSGIIGALVISWAIRKSAPSEKVAEQFTEQLL